MYSERKALYEKIEHERGSKVIAYVTGDRKNLENRISGDDPDILAEHLDAIGRADKISVIIYTNGGDICAAWTIINLIREYCNELEIIVPNKCRNAGTLMALGADNIVMTKQATLSPIDQGITDTVRSVIPDKVPSLTLPISVDSVKGYIQLLREEFRVHKHRSIANAYMKLTEFVNPLTIGDAYSTDKQVKVIAEKLLEMSKYRKHDIRNLIPAICSDSGKLDLTINMIQAQEMGLHVEASSDELYKDLKAWYDDISSELELKDPYIPGIELGDKYSKHYSFKRGLIESTEYGQDVYVSAGILSKVRDAEGKLGVAATDDKSVWQHNT